MPMAMRLCSSAVDGPTFPVCGVIAVGPGFKSPNNSRPADVPQVSPGDGADGAQRTLGEVVSSTLLPLKFWPAATQAVDSRGDNPGGDNPGGGDGNSAGHSLSSGMFFCNVGTGAPGLFKSDNNSFPAISLDDKIFGGVSGPSLDASSKCRPAALVGVHGVIGVAGNEPA